MVIHCKKIRELARYLFPFSPGEGLYVAIHVPKGMDERLAQYGLQLDGIDRIPIPRGAATRFNANGRWQIQKHLPKEPRQIEHAYHIVDWHGEDHYGTCWVTRMCYPRVLVPPTEISIHFENGVFLSPLFYNDPSESDMIKAAVNVMLEIFGSCELLNAEKDSALPPAKQIDVSWEILPQGTSNRVEWEKYIGEITASKSTAQKAIIVKRHEHLWKQNPDFCVTGSQSFWGYVVYGFTKQNLYIFECDHPDNATYVFGGDWTSASKLTKSEILCGNIQEARLFHTNTWPDKICSIINAGRM